MQGPSPAFLVCQGPRRGRPRRWCGSPGPRSRPLARPPRSPLRLSQPSAMRPVPAPGLSSRVGGVPGAAVGAAAWLAGAAVSASRASGAPSRGGAAGLAAWAAGASTLAGSGSWVDGPVSAEAARGCPAGGPTSTAASASLRSSRSAGVSPVHSGETGEQERDRRWWRSSRWEEPSESAITVILVGMGGGRCALPTTSLCISVVPCAVPCGALRGGGGKGLGAGCGVSPVRAGAGGHPSALGGEAWEPRGPRVAPQLSIWGRAHGPGPWAPGGRRVVPGGSRTRWTPVTAVTSCVRRKVCTPSRAAGAGKGGGGYGCCPIEVGGGDPQDPFWVPAGCDDEEDQGGARTLLPEDLPPVVGTPGS